MNRIEAGITKCQTKIEAKNYPPEKLAALHKAMDMDFNEYCRFQTLKSAHVGNKLTLDEAQSIYVYLGNAPEFFNEQPLPVKYVLTEVFAALLK